MIDIAAVLAQKDPALRAQMASELISEYQRHQAALSVIRRNAINELIVKGLMSATEIATMLDLSKSRLSQINKGGR